MIRKGTLDDIEAVMRLGHQLHKESSYDHVTFNPEKAAATCKLLIEHGFMVVAEIDGEIVGGMMGDTTAMWYTDDLIGIDYSLYVDPAHRNGLIAARLVVKFIEWCKEMGCKQIRPGVGTGICGVGRLYEHMGFKMVGNQYCMDV